MDILLIEDNPGDIRLLQEYLKEGGTCRFQITQVDRLSVGLARLAEACFDVVLLDLTLPDSQGIDTLHRLHEAAKGVPIVVLTGTEDDVLGVQLIQAGAQDYLIKGQVTGSLVMRSIRYAVERKRAKDALQRALGDLRALTRKLEAVREDERTRIARELHDELGMRMTCLKMDLARLRVLMNSASRSAVEEKLQSMTEVVDTTIVAVQALVSELRPGVLDDLGLVAAVEWQCRDVERRSGIRCFVDSEEGDIPLASAKATAAFRICQEALINVVRHAGAKEVRVRLETLEGFLRLEIHDDGQGILPARITEATSLGLLGMRERAEAVGGTFRIVGLPGQGTTVTVRVPCG
ncbi:MAG: response regulator [Nitrospirota bacterium]|nr:response regulator [Nitrospirota bacterium]MDP3599456.1 response regulator [Nitrospirota bacterium]